MNFNANIPSLFVDNDSTTSGATFASTEHQLVARWDSNSEMDQIHLEAKGKSPSGTNWRINKKRIGPKLYFKYVKSKLTKVESKNLNKRLTALKTMIEDAEELGQVALFEELSKQIMLAVQQAELLSCGIKQAIEEKYIKKFMGICSEKDDRDSNDWGRDNKIIYFKPLKEFPRKIPAKVKAKIKKVQEKKLFKELMILYLDYTKNSTEIKSNKEKIREKDPILFGRDRYRENVLYYITDWVDEVCDLTLDQIIEKEEDSVKDLLDINKEYINKLKKELIVKEKRLKETDPSNYKDKMKEEDEFPHPPLLTPPTPPPTREIKEGHNPDPNAKGILTKLKEIFWK